MSHTHAGRKHARIHVKKPGLPPGEIVFTGTQKLETATIEVITFDENKAHRHRFTSAHASQLPSGSRFIWINVFGIHDTSLISTLGSIYHINELVLEDITDVDQIPKFVEGHEGSFLSFQSLKCDPVTKDIHKEQISIFYNQKFVLSFQEDIYDEFTTIHDRIRNPRSRFHSRQSDFLIYSMLDVVVDNYLNVIQQFQTKIIELELQIENNPAGRLKSLIYALRQDILLFIKSAYPLKDAVMRYKSSDLAFIQEETITYLNNLDGHNSQVNRLIDMVNSQVNYLSDLFHAELNERSNSVILTLTLITSIFIPLSFIVGVYGMNFTNMPELSWRWGYAAIWGIMLLITSMVIVYFKRKKWL